MKINSMDLQLIEGDFSIAKVKEWSPELMEQEYTFLAKTDRERSIICPTEKMPKSTITREDHWKCFRIAEDASFEKYGMIAFLADIIAGEETSTLVVGTFDTDYLFIKEEKFEQVKSVLLENHCRFI